MSSTQSIENLINGYAISEDSSFLVPNATEDFLAVRPSGNPISAQGLVGMFNSKDLVAESSEQIKTHKIENYGEIAFAVFSLNKSSFIKENKIKIFQLILAFLKMNTVRGNRPGCKDHKELLICKLGNK